MKRTRLINVNPGDPITARGQNGLIDAVNRLQNFSVGDGLRNRNFGDSYVLEVDQNAMAAAVGRIEYVELLADIVPDVVDTAPEESSTSLGTSSQVFSDSSIGTSSSLNSTSESFGLSSGASSASEASSDSSVSTASSGSSFSSQGNSSDNTSSSVHSTGSSGTSSSSSSVFSSTKDKYTRSAILLKWNPAIKRWERDGYNFIEVSDQGLRRGQGVFDSGDRLFVYLHRQSNLWLPMPQGNVRIAVTVREQHDDLTADYPVGAGSPNVYPIAFCDAEYTDLAGDGDLVVVKKNPPPAPHNYVCNLSSSYIPEATSILVFHQQGRWYTVYNATPEKLVHIARYYTTSLGVPYVRHGNTIAASQWGTVEIDGGVTAVGDTICYDPKTPDGGLWQVTVAGDGGTFVSTGSSFHAARVVFTSAIDLIDPPLSCDDISFDDYDVVLLTGQSNAAENGVYYWHTNGVMIRHTTANSSAEVTNGFEVWVTEGTVNKQTLWSLTTSNPITLGSTPLTFTKQTSTGKKSMTLMRATDFNNAARPGAMVVVTNGKVNKNSLWKLTEADPASLEYGGSKGRDFVADGTANYARLFSDNDFRDGLVADYAFLSWGISYVRTGDFINSYPNNFVGMPVGAAPGLTAIGHKILINDGTADAGIWEITAPQGARRVSGFDSASGIKSGTSIRILHAPAMTAANYFLDTPDPIVINTSSLTFSVFTPGFTVTADVITMNGVGGLFVDGIVPSVGDKIALNTRLGANILSGPSYSGVWQVTNAGSASTAATLALVDDTPGKKTWIDEGVNHGKSLYELKTGQFGGTYATDTTRFVKLAQELDTFRVADVYTASLPEFTASANWLSGSVDGVLPNIDGVTPIVGMTVIYDAGATDSETGFWKIGSIGSTTSSWWFYKAESFPLLNPFPVKLEGWAVVKGGTVYTNTVWQYRSSGLLDINKSALTFTRLSPQVRPPLFTAKWYTRGLKAPLYVKDGDTLVGINGYTGYGFQWMTAEDKILVNGDKILLDVGTKSANSSHCGLWIVVEDGTAGPAKMIRDPDYDFTPLSQIVTNWGGAPMGGAAITMTQISHTVSEGEHVAAWTAGGISMDPVSSGGSYDEWLDLLSGALPGQSLKKFQLLDTGAQYVPSGYGRETGNRNAVWQYDMLAGPLGWGVLRAGSIIDDPFTNGGAGGLGVIVHSGKLAVNPNKVASPVNFTLDGGVFKVITYTGNPTVATTHTGATGTMGMGAQVVGGIVVTGGASGATGTITIPGYTLNIVNGILVSATPTVTVITGGSF